jgi:hypothetical protein
MNPGPGRAPDPLRRTVDSLTGELLTVYEELALLYSMAAQFGRLTTTEQVALAALKEAMDVLRLGDNLQDSMARWNNLPAIYHYLALPQLKPNVVRSLLVEKDSQLPVLLESRLGNGRVLFLGLSESWRWRMRVAERDQDRFWLQLVRYGGEEPYALVNDELIQADSADELYDKIVEQLR